jgi:predicted GNAT family acetyltransferase
MPDESVIEVSVRDNRERSRYEAVLDGRVVGIADYRVVGERVEFPHTEVEPRLRGRGIAAQLVGVALADVQAAGHEVVPQCSYVVDYVREHPEYQARSGSQSH